MSEIPEITAYKKAVEGVEKLISTCGTDREGISKLFTIWQLKIEENKAVKDRLKELYPEIPADATPWFYIKTVSKQNKNEKKEYQYLQIKWSRTIHEEGKDPLTEEDDIHLGSLSKYVSWTEIVKKNPKNTVRDDR